MLKPIVPEFLKEGDKLAIVSPASAVNPDFIQGACNAVKRWGFVPVQSEHCCGKYGYYSGTIEERLADFKKALYNPEIKAILCGRGGYGTIHLAEFISLEDIRANPKWIIGFSDISILHAICYNAGVASIHASMAKHLTLFDEHNYCNVSLCNILKGILPIYKTISHPLNRCGTAKGNLTGGNLAVLSSLRGLKYDIFTPGNILFIEDIGEPIYKVERMLYNLKLSGVLSQLRGLIVGRFTECKEPDGNGESMYAMIHRMVACYDFPVAFIFPIGHIDDNVPLLESVCVELIVTDEFTKLSFK